MSHDPHSEQLKPSWRWSQGYSDTWGPYWEYLFPPGLLTPWLNWKLGSTGVNVAQKLWREREYLRRNFEAVFGDDPDVWPSSHPGVVLGMRHAACLRCRWLNGCGRFSALSVAHRHETSNGLFLTHRPTEATNAAGPGTRGENA